ncbi:MAG: methenyltetrahydromethanopterin cyclohydrolase [Candidatus Bathyarchaeota archaeon]|nr:MAG: methenyltetrahydromethanopterin cyclohydrolase [Candidatus Bathyarchaeota archaeon]
MLKVNEKAYQLVNILLDDAENYGVFAEETKSGATLIDVGIKAQGGFLTGKIITEICLGGYGKVDVFPASYDGFVLPSVFVQTDHPTIATLGSQFAGWHIKAEGYSAIGSGPARALALKPKALYEEIQYKDHADLGVLVLETSKAPPDKVIQQISEKCNIKTSRLTIILVPTSSLAGFIQVSGRIVETGLHKLRKLGLDPRVVEYAWGYAPIVPLHPKFDEAMGRTNDAILYTGMAHYIVSYDNDKELERIVNMAPSSASKWMQEARKLKKNSPSFLEILKEAEYDFYKIDPNMFAPAIVVVNNKKTGKIFQAGSFDFEVLKTSLKLG